MARLNQQRNRTLCFLAMTALAMPDPSSAQEVGGPDFKVELNVNGCQFSGGSDGYGNVEVPQKTGGKKIQVELLYGDDYRFEPVQFSGPGAEQMKESAGGNANVLNIFNANTGPADVKYSISLRNQQTGKTLRCDPRITNT